MTTPVEVLEFWFGELRDGWTVEDRNAMWFGVDSRYDESVRQRFGEVLEQAGRGDLDHWMSTADGALALIIVLDQFSRNVHRGTATAFANDVRAIARAGETVSHQLDGQLAFVQRQFVYMPFMHSEVLAEQERCVQLCEGLLQELPPPYHERGKKLVFYAREHRDLIARFGRFPYRNRLLGRSSTEEELAWLSRSRENYGQE